MVVWVLVYGSYLQVVFCLYRFDYTWICIQQPILNEHVWYGQLWGPSQRVVTLLQLTKIPTCCELKFEQSLVALVRMVYEQSLVACLASVDVDKNLLCLRSSNHLFSKRPSNQRSAPVLVLAKYSHLITMLMIMNGWMNYEWTVNVPWINYERTRQHSF